MTDENIRTESFIVNGPDQVDVEVPRLLEQYPGWLGSVQQQLDQPDGTVRVVIRYSRSGKPQEMNPLSGL